MPPARWNRRANRPLQPNATYIERHTGYQYRTDAQGRVTQFSGNLQRALGNRNAYQQRKVGGK